MFFSWQFPEYSLYLEGSGKVSDAALLMQKLYDYWYHKGYWGAVSASAVDFLNAFAVFVVAFLFTVHFRWAFALDCASEMECGSGALMSGFAFPHLFRRTFLGHLSGLVVLLATGGAALYEGVSMAANIFIFHEIETMVRDTDIDPGFLSPLHRWQHDRHRRAARREGHEAVGLRRGARRVLSLMNWGDFLETMCGYLSAEKKLKRCDGGVRFDALRAMQTLMRKENFLIALQDSELLDEGALRHLSPETAMFLISCALDPFGVVYPRDEGLWKVRERATRYAVANLALYFFVAAFAVLKLLVKNAGQFKSDFRDFSQRDWNSRAVWCFRLYNEAPYLHASRLANGRETACAMAERLAVSKNTRHLLRRLSSACILVTMVLTFLNPSLFTGGSIGGLSLVWWLTIALLVFSTFGIPDPREREYVYSADLEKLISQIHFSDAEWVESGESFYNHLTTHLLKPRVLLTFESLLRSLAAPFILLYSLQDGSVSALLHFMRTHSVVVDGVGSVPVDAVFERDSIDARAADDEGADVDGDSSTASSLLPHSGGAPHAARAELASPWATSLEQNRREKLEKSIASFCAVYPQWMAERLEAAQCDRDSGNQPLYDFVQELNDRVQDFVSASRHCLYHAAAGPDGGRIFGSLHQSWAAPGPPQPQPREGQSRGRDEAASETPRTPDWYGGTAHEREQLFVSQVPSAHTRALTDEQRSHTAFGGGYGTGGEPQRRGQKRDRATGGGGDEQM